MGCCNLLPCPSAKSGCNVTINYDLLTRLGGGGAVVGFSADGLFGGPLSAAVDGDYATILDGGEAFESSSRRKRDKSVQI